MPEETKPNRLMDVINFEEAAKTMSPEKLAELKRNAKFLDSILGPIVDSKARSKGKKDEILSAIDNYVDGAFKEYQSEKMNWHLDYILCKMGRNDDESRQLLAQEIETTLEPLRKKALDVFRDEFDKHGMIFRSSVNEVFHDGELFMSLSLGRGFLEGDAENGYVEFHTGLTKAGSEKYMNLKKKAANGKKGNRNICKDVEKFKLVLFEYLKGKKGLDLCPFGYEEEEDHSYCEFDWECSLVEDIEKIDRILVFDDNVHFNVHAVGENVYAENKHIDFDAKPGEILGFDQLPTGECFFGYSKAGDWEDPVNFIIYVEDGKVKVYAPEKGNHFNEKTYKAYGNEHDDPEEEAREEKARENCDYDYYAEREDIADYFFHRGEFEHADGTSFLED